MNTSKPVIGSEGDFITSPEISQVFGEVESFMHSRVPGDNDRPVSFVASWCMAPLAMDVCRVRSRNPLAGARARAWNAHARCSEGM